VLSTDTVAVEPAPLNEVVIAAAIALFVEHRRTLWPYLKLNFFILYRSVSRVIRRIRAACV
jgi:hypothetical protein